MPDELKIIPNQNLGAMGETQTGNPFENLDDTPQSTLPDGFYRLDGRDSLQFAVAALVANFLGSVLFLAAVPILASIGLMSGIRGVRRCRHRSRSGLQLAVAGIVVNGLLAIAWLYSMAMSVVRSWA